MALQEELEKQGIWLFRYRGVLPMVILAIGAILYLRSQFYPHLYFLQNVRYEFYFEMLCLAISLGGLAVRIYTVGNTPKNTSGRNVKEQVADELNTTGIYSIVRHPLYLGNFFIWLGPAILTGHFWFVIAFCLFYWVYYERIMFAEEQFLRRKFGVKYQEWSAKTPAFFPNFSLFKKSTLSFSWKKVLKKEKNVLAGIFLLFTIFDLACGLMDKTHQINYFLLSACLLTGVMYAILKYLKKKTTVLDEDGR